MVAKLEKAMPPPEREDVQAPNPGCSGEMTCICDWCTAERVRRVKRGIRPTVKPWQPRPRKGL
jgi:hypothetical protein